MSMLPVTSASEPHKSILVGDLKLADFKQFLVSKGVQVFDQKFKIPMYFSFLILMVNTEVRTNGLNNSFSLHR